MFNLLKFKFNKFNNWKSDSKTSSYSNLFNNSQDFFDSAYYQLLIVNLIKKIGEVTTKQDEILDVGCGEGYLTREIYKIPRKVSGIDISSNLIKKAKEINPKINYKLQNLEEKNSNVFYKKFSLVISNLVLMYLKDIEIAVQNLSQYLKPNGRLIITITHPCFNQKNNQPWFLDNLKKPLKITNYFDENMFFKRIANQFATHHFHRSLETYFNVFKGSNLILDELIEPKPTKNNTPILLKASKIPFFIIFVLKKTAN